VNITLIRDIFNDISTGGSIDNRSIVIGYHKIGDVPGFTIDVVTVFDEDAQRKSRTPNLRRLVHKYLNIPSHVGWRRLLKSGEFGDLSDNTFALKFLSYLTSKFGKSKGEQIYKDLSDKLNKGEVNIESVLKFVEELESEEPTAVSRQPERVAVEEKAHPTSIEDDVWEFTKWVQYRCLFKLLYMMMYDERTFRKVMNPVAVNSETYNKIRDVYNLHEAYSDNLNLICNRYSSRKASEILNVGVKDNWSAIVSRYNELFDGAVDEGDVGSLGQIMLAFLTIIWIRIGMRRYGYGVPNIFYQEYVPYLALVPERYRDSVTYIDLDFIPAKKYRKRQIRQQTGET